MISSSEIKEMVLGYGADLCGIATVDRFVEAPEGFKPTDLYTDCKSVLVFAKKLPESIFLTNSSIPYSFADDFATNEVLRLTYELSIKLEKLNISAMPIPSTPYEYWDSDTMTGKGMISFKHAGYLAGLGVIGRNSLLTNPDYGNLIKLGVLLLNIELESDTIIDYDFCSDNCNLCIDNCPSKALGGVSVIQKNCRLNSEGTTKKGAPITICYNCRKICPNRTGWKINKE
jgi:epoxyqueuosine reductase QueG